MGAKRQRIEAEQAKRHWKAAVRAERPSEASAAFTQYYRQQFRHLLATEEWPAFFATLSRSLPVTVRLNQTAVSAIAVDHRLRQSSDAAAQQAGDGPLTERIAWASDEVAWQINEDRAAPRTNPALRPLHALLDREMALGHLSRQEAVSMVPALLLRVQPSHWVLDMCASPGSKTRQLLEIMQLAAPDGLPSGVLVGNDSDPLRTAHLRRQFRRLGSPALVLTCERGEAIAARLTGCGSSPFDRILCDVPCSGDGTFRKAPELWRKWSPEAGGQLHPLQLQLALHAFALLKPGGRMVYSTCSMNPVENEAVVCELLRWAAGAAHLVDVSEELPGLKRRAGLSTWQLEPAQSTRLPSMLPPTQTEVAALHLERCVRILPHDQNTGGFFIAVIAKTCDTALRVEDFVEAQQAVSVLRAMDFHASSSSPGLRRPCFIPLPPHLVEQLGRNLGSQLPAGQLWLHRPAPRRRKDGAALPAGEPAVQLVSPAVAELLSRCPALRVLEAGSTVFHLGGGTAGSSSGSQPQRGIPPGPATAFRPHPDGMVHLLPFVPRRCLSLTADTFEAVCKSLEPLSDTKCQAQQAKRTNDDLQLRGDVDLRKMLGDLEPLTNSASGDFVILVLSPGHRTVLPGLPRMGSVAAGASGARAPTGEWQPLTLTLQLGGPQARCLTSADRVSSFLDTLASLRAVGWRWPPVQQPGDAPARPPPWASERPGEARKAPASRGGRRRL